GRGEASVGQSDAGRGRAAERRDKPRAHACRRRPAGWPGVAAPLGSPRPGGDPAAARGRRARRLRVRAGERSRGVPPPRPAGVLAPVSRAGGGRDDDRAPPGRGVLM
ncbi:MAG: hypothetical protein AVDCRST_MAG85-578, partial [uncultured Solirubrobacteraceae bacterium]